MFCFPIVWTLSGLLSRLLVKTNVQGFIRFLLKLNSKLNYSNRYNILIHKYVGDCFCFKTKFSKYVF